MPDTTTYVPQLPWQTRSTDPSFGQCLAGVSDATGGMVSGRLALAQALARMLETVQGTNVCDVDYGYDLARDLYGRADAASLSQDAASITTQFLRDDRVRDAQVSVTFAGGVKTVAATIFDGDGPFPLTLSTSDAGIVLLKVGK